MSTPELERPLFHSHTCLQRAGESPVSLYLQPPPPQRTGRGTDKARKISRLSFKGRSLLSQMADWDFGTLGVFVQPVRRDFDTDGLEGGGY